MKLHLETKSPVEALQVSLAAYKSLVSDYALRARQAEDMVVLLMNEKIPKEVLIDSVVNKVQEHCDSRGIERSTQYLGVIQTTLIALTELQKHPNNAGITEIIKALTVTLNSG